MEELLPRQKAVYELFLEGLNGNQIAHRLRVNRATIYKDLELLEERYNIARKTKHHKVPDVVDNLLPTDIFLQELVDAQFTDLQKEFVKRNQHLGRSKLAKMLRINKSIFNHMLQKEGIMIETRLETKE